MHIEHIIFSNLTTNEQYVRKVIPFLKSDYFHNDQDKTLYNLITDYIAKYDALPTKEALKIDLCNLKNISQQQYDQCNTLIDELEASKDTSIDWLVDNTEKFCKDKALYNALMQSIKIVDDLSLIHI